MRLQQKRALWELMLGFRWLNRSGVQHGERSRTQGWRVELLLCIESRPFLWGASPWWWWWGWKWWGGEEADWALFWLHRALWWGWSCDKASLRAWCPMWSSFWHQLLPEVWLYRSAGFCLDCFHVQAGEIEQFPSSSPMYYVQPYIPVSAILQQASGIWSLSSACAAWKRHGFFLPGHVVGWQGDTDCWYGWNHN